MSKDEKEIVEETDEQIKARLNPPDPVEDEPEAAEDGDKTPEPTEEEITEDEPKPVIVDLPNDDDDQGVQDGDYSDLTDEDGDEAFDPEIGF